MKLYPGQRIIVLFTDLDSCISECSDLENYVRIDERSEYLPVAYATVMVPVTVKHLVFNTRHVVNIMPDDTIRICDFPSTQSWNKKFTNNWTTYQLKSLLNAHDTGYTGKGVTVAILDSGVDSSHPQLKGKVVAKSKVIEGDMEDDVGHGTAVASIICGRQVDSEFGLIEGIAPEANIINIKVFDVDGNGTYSGFIKGLDKALDLGCDVVNYSGGGFNSAGNALQDIVVDSLAHHNVLVSCPTGNEGRRVNSPASARNAVSVGGFNTKFAKSDFSNYRTVDKRFKPDVVSYAGDDAGQGLIAGTAGWMSREYSYKSLLYRPVKGTSFACPAITGMMAQLLESNDVMLSREELQSCFENTSLLKRKYALWGWGIPDTKAAIEYLKKISKGGGRYNDVA